MTAIVLSAICAVLSQATVVADESFAQEVQTTFRIAEGDAGEVWGIVLLPDGVPLASTSSGLFRFDGNEWRAAPAQPGFVPRMLRIGSDGRVWAAAGSRLAYNEGNGWTEVPLPEGTIITAVAAQGNGLFVGTQGNVAFNVTDDGEVKALESLPLAAVAASEGRLVRALQSPPVEGHGPMLYDRVPLPTVTDGKRSWQVSGVGALAIESGKVWFGDVNGAGVFDGERWTLYTGEEGLPYNRFTCAAPGEAGVIWFGTERGAIRFDGKRWSYRAGKRWVPDDRVNAICVDPATGTAWIATPKGISRIERRSMTLAEKAANFERLIDERHRRLDFVTRCNMKVPGDFSTAATRETDNDGLYTSMYGASQAFRYAATKDPAAKERAQRCFNALKFLVDVTGIPGFPARSVLPTDGSVEDPNIRFGEKQNLEMQKEDPLWKNIVPRWPKSADGKFWWKCDTSSDEIAGHYFFYGLYYDLVAETPEEKAAVVQLTRDVTNHIVDHGHKLVDHDGLPTRWANWSPEYVYSMDGHADAGIQAQEMLAFLNVALHVTGDAKYAEAAKTLREKHGYHILAVQGRAKWPPRNVVPWDNNLAFLSYYPLLKYETDPALVQTYRTSLDYAWSFIARQNDPFFNLVYAAVMPDQDKPLFDDVKGDFVAPVVKGVQTLRDTPLELVGWRMENSHRLDVEMDRAPHPEGKYGWSAVTGEAFPVNERSHIRINSDNFNLDYDMGDGKTEYEGTYYLLPYYLGLYHGFVR